MKVSIIIPIYNVALYITDCLASVYNQTYANVEVVLVNDSTLDNSMQVAAPSIELLKTKFKVVVVEHPSNKGLSAARNSGVTSSSGDWIYFLDSDDEISADCIEQHVNVIKKYPTVDFSIAGIKVVDANKTYPLEIPQYTNSADEIISGYITGKWYVMAVNKLLRKTLFVSSNLWFEEGLLHEDELFSLKLAFSAHTMCAIDVDTYIYKIRSTGSITAQRNLKNFEHYLRINQEKNRYISTKFTGNHRLRSSFVINTAYHFILVAAANSNISDSECKTVIYKQLSLYETVKSLADDCDILLRIKKCILSLPYCLLKPIAALHFRYVNR